MNTTLVNIGKNLTKFKGQAMALLSAHSPEILTGLGVAGLIGTVVLTAKQSVKIDRVLAQAEYDKGEPLTVKETARLVWKDVIPVAISAAGTAACIVASHQISANRRAAIMAAYTLAEAKLDDYKKKTEELLGKETADKIQHEVNADKAEISAGAIFERGCYGGDVKVLDRLTGRTFYASKNAIDAAVNATNAQIIRDWSATLNDFYYNLGLEPSKVGDELGWNSNNLIVMAYDAIEEGGELVLVLEYEAYPEYRLL